MKFVLSAIGIILACGHASADDCTRWTFERVEDEGGKAPVASVCSPGGQHSLVIRCNGQGKYSVWFYAREGAVERDEGYAGPYRFDIGDDTFRRKLTFQAMDGALVTDDERPAGPLIAALLNGKQVKVTPEDGKDEGEGFALSGSGAAFAALVKACAAGG